MYRKRILYPFLLIVYLLLNPLVNNLDQLNPSQVYRPLFFLVLAASLIMLLVVWISKDWHYAGYLTFLLLAFFFVYGHVTRVVQDWLLVREYQWVQLALMLIWWVVFLVLAFRRIWLRFGSEQMTAYLNLVLTVAVVIQVIVGLRKYDLDPYTSLRTPDGKGAPPGEILNGFNCQSRPDIYYLVLDGYGGADALEMLYGLDNTSFLEYLQDKGFYIAEESRTNYTQTVYSIPSVLNFSYVEPNPKSVSGAQYFRRRVVDNEVMELLDRCGYQVIAFESGFYFTNQLPVDRYFSPGFRLNEFESLLLSRTPLDFLALKFDRVVSDQNFRAHRNRIIYTFDRLARIPRISGAKFVFAHILSPHPPFVFDASGDEIYPEWSYSIGDGDEYPGTWEAYRSGYAGQVQFINELVKKMVDSILAESSESPIIIIQGDHGPGGHLDWSTPEGTCLLERTSILNAYFLPDEAESLLYPSISPVNTFRVIFNAHFGAHLEMLPDETYFASHRLPHQAVDITDKRESTENCY